MRNYLVVGRIRYWMEDIRPKMYQYFIESDIDGSPLTALTVPRYTMCKTADGYHALWYAIECI